MNNRIRGIFKAKDKSTSEWVYGHLMEHFEKYYIYYEEDDEMCQVGRWLQSAEVIPETICEYTNIVDNAGKMIYENDVVETKYGRLCKVVWYSSNSYIGWDLEAITTKENLELPTPDGWDLWKPSNLTLMGNIHDDNNNIYKE